MPDLHLQTQVDLNVNCTIGTDGRSSFFKVLKIVKFC